MYIADTWEFFARGPKDRKAFRTSTVSQVLAPTAPLTVPFLSQPPELGWHTRVCLFPVGGKKKRTKHFIVYHIRDRHLSAKKSEWYLAS